MAKINKTTAAHSVQRKTPKVAIANRRLRHDTTKNTAIVRAAQTPSKTVDLIHWLRGGSNQKDTIRSVFDEINMAIEGVTRASIDNLATRLGISKKKLAEDILLVSVKTLERKRPQERLDKKTSSHAMVIAKVMQHAYQVFEDEEKVKNWMNRENRALNARKPIEMLETLSGINLVDDILGRIEEGVYS